MARWHSKVSVSWSDRIAAGSVNQPHKPAGFDQSGGMGSSKITVIHMKNTGGRLSKVEKNIALRKSKNYITGWEKTDTFSLSLSCSKLAFCADFTADAVARLHKSHSFKPASHSKKQAGAQFRLKSSNWWVFVWSYADNLPLEIAHVFCLIQFFKSFTLLPNLCPLFKIFLLSELVLRRMFHHKTYLLNKRDVQ